MEQNLIELDLPWPPSVNQIWKTNRRGQWFSTPQAKQYKLAVSWYIRDKNFYGAFPKQADLEFSLWAYPPDRRKRDLDNLAKVVCDALQDGCLYINDSQIKVIHMTMCDPRDNGGIRIQVKRLENCAKT